MQFWNALTCFAVVAAVYAVSEWLSVKSKGTISSLIIASVLFIIGFWSGLFPDDITNQTGLLVVMSSFGVALLITNLGTLIDMEDLCREWRTVVIALGGILGIAVVCFTVGTWLFGREYALTAAPPISGGTIAGIIVSEAAQQAGRPELGAFAILVLAFQKFFGMPIATLCLKHDLNRKLKAGDFDRDVVHNDNLKIPNMRIFKEPKKETNTPISNLTRLAIVAAIANFAGLATLIPGSDPANYWLNPNIAYLLFGILFARLGFLQRANIDKAGAGGLLMFGLMVMLPGNFAQITPAELLGMVLPLVGLLALCSIGIVIVCVLLGKLLKYSPAMSASIGVTAMFGYPGTQILSLESTAALDCTEEQRQRALDYVMPKMIVGGFVTVTIASVAFAGIIAPIIFA